MKFLAVKLAALKSELDVSIEIHSSASREVDRMFAEKYFPELPANKEQAEDKDVAHKETEQQEQQEQQYHDQSEANPQQNISPSEKIASPEVKKMFKKIALKIHPDKLEELEDGYEKQKKQKLFERARKALEEDDILGLSEIAMEIDVEVPEITQLTLKKTEEKIISLKQKLKDIESTVVWHWFFCEDPHQKEKMLEQLFELMYAHNIRS